MPHRSLDHRGYARLCAQGDVEAVEEALLRSLDTAFSLVTRLPLFHPRI